MLETRFSFKVHQSDLVFFSLPAHTFLSILVVSFLLLTFHFTLLLRSLDGAIWVPFFHFLWFEQKQGTDLEAEIWKYCHEYERLGRFFIHRFFLFQSDPVRVGESRRIHYALEHFGKL